MRTLVLALGLTVLPLADGAALSLDADCQPDGVIARQRAEWWPEEFWRGQAEALVHQMNALTDEIDSLLGEIEQAHIDKKRAHEDTQMMLRQGVLTETDAKELDSMEDGTTAVYLDALADQLAGADQARDRIGWCITVVVGIIKKSRP